MNISRSLLIALGLACSTTLFGTTLGSSETTCPVASLATYESLGTGGCMVNGVTFNNFALLVSYSNGITPTPTASDIILSPAGGGDAGASIGIAYPLTTRNYVSFSLGYDFDPVPAVGGTGLDLDVMGDVDVFQSVCPGGSFSSGVGGCYGRPGDRTPVNVEVYNEHNGQTRLTDSAIISPAVHNGGVQIYVVLNGLPNAPAGFDQISSLVASPVPEPATYLLLIGGFGVFGGFRIFWKRRAITD